MSGPLNIEGQELPIQYVMKDATPHESATHMKCTMTACFPSRSGCLSRTHGPMQCLIYEDKVILIPWLSYQTEIAAAQLRRKFIPAPCVPGQVVAANLKLIGAYTHLCDKASLKSVL